MNYLKGYKPVELNKGDLKTLDRFSDLEEKDSKYILYIYMLQLFPLVIIMKK